jgi:hypothetical protein
VSGADGGIAVVGVAAGNGAGGASPGSVGAAIAGAFGTLTLNADGSYSYVHAIGGGSDVFTYTIRDADGSLAHTTLTFRIPDSVPGNITIPQAGNPGVGTEVFEAGLPARTIAGTAETAGSQTGNPAFSPETSGTVSFTSADGVSKIELGTLVLTAPGITQTVSDATGSLTASFTYDSATGAGTISYTSPDLESRRVLSSEEEIPISVWCIAVDSPALRAFGLAPFRNRQRSAPKAGLVSAPKNLRVGFAPRCGCDRTRRGFCSVTSGSGGVGTARAR